MRLPHAAALLLLIVLLGLPVGARAQTPTVVTLSVDVASGPADSEVGLSTRLTLGDGTPLAGAPITLERSSGSAWSPVATPITDAAGLAAIQVRIDRDPEANAFRVVYAGNADWSPATSAPVTVAISPVASTLGLQAPRRLVDERSATLEVRWMTSDGRGIPGPVEVQTRRARHGWERLTVVTTDGSGRATLRFGPRQDVEVRARAASTTWTSGAASPSHRIDNLPPGRPVRWPRHAPPPRIALPPQAHAVGAGPNAVITPIPDGTWRSMIGRSWRPGCVPRGALRLLRINYWDYTGYRRRGELVAHAAAIDNMAGAFSAMYRKRLPIRAMYLADYFGYSPILRGANDYKSMAAGNTSAFNCREVVNRRGVTSPHASGFALDINTWENPYRSPTGLVPNVWWQGHADPRFAWRSSSHPVVRIMRQHGLRWTYGLGDTQHFDVVGHNRIGAALYRRTGIVLH